MAVEAKDAQNGLDALINPMKISVARLALLEKIKSPLFFGKVDTFLATSKSLWVMFAPIDEIVKVIDSEDATNAACLKWAEGIDFEEYSKKLREALAGIVKFWEMMPKPESSGEVAGDGGTPGKKASTDSATGS